MKVWCVNTNETNLGDIDLAKLLEEIGKRKG